MKFSVSTAKLTDMINRTERVTSRKSALPILSKLLIKISANKLLIRSTNLEVGVEGTVAISDSDIDKDLDFTVEANVLKNFLQQVRSSKNVSVAISDSTALFSTPTAKATIAISGADDFPSLPQFESGAKNNTLSLKASDFIDSINSVSYASATSTMKPELSSIYIHSYNNELYFVATDTFRLAEKVLPIKTESEISLLIPQQNAVELTKIIDPEVDMTCKFDENLLIVTQKDLVITVRVVDGNFPDYRQIIPAEFTTEATVLFYDYENSLRLSSIFADKYHQLTVSFSDKEVAIDSKGNEQGQSSTTLPASVSGEAMSSKFNQRYLAEPLNSLKGDNLVLRLSENKPMMVTNPSDTSFRYLVMPMHQ